MAAEFATANDELAYEPAELAALKAGWICGVTLLAAATMGRKTYGFEIKKNYYKEANNLILKNIQNEIFI